MKEILLSLLISSVTVVAGYIVLKESDIDITSLWKKETKEEKVSGKKFKAEESDPQVKKFKKKFFSKKKPSLKKKFKKKKAFEPIEKNITQKSKRIPKKTSVISQKRKASTVSDKPIEKKNIKNSPQKKEPPTVPKEKIAYAPTKKEELEAEVESKIKSSKKTLVNYEPELISVSLKEVTEVDLEDLIIDINDKNTKKDVDRNGDSISYTCSFTSENREEGMVVDGSCDDIGDVNFYFDQKTGILKWSFNEPGSNISGNYFFKITGNDGIFSDSTQFQVNVSNINVSGPENNTSSLNNLINTGESVVNVPNAGNEN